MRKKFVAGNWKMNCTVAEARELASAVVKSLGNGTNKYLVAPPYTALASVKEVIKGSNVLLGAQNMAHLESGALTGEVSPSMLKELGVDAVILGHSERRTYFHESDQLINQKIHLALKHGFEVIFCIGETLEERESGKAVDVVNHQIKSGLENISADAMKSITLAYEPVWAIGTGRTATPEDANSMHRAIRKTLSAMYSGDLAESVVIQYGGSVKADNAKELLTMSDIDGALVGGASLKADSFAAIALFDR